MRERMLPTAVNFIYCGRFIDYLRASPTLYAQRLYCPRCLPFRGFRHFGEIQTLRTGGRFNGGKLLKDSFQNMNMGHWER